MRELFLAAFFLLIIPSQAFCIAPPTPGSSEDLQWTSPATVHDLKKKSDLHNSVTSILALTELEFLRLGDAAINLPLGTHSRPLENMADSVDHSYHRIPQVRPVHRVAQLVDALQIRQIRRHAINFFTKTLATKRQAATANVAR